MGYVAFYSPHRFIRLFDRARQCGVRDNNKHQQHQSIAIAENINGITNFNTQDISNVINTKTQKHSSATRQQQQHSRARFVCVCCGAFATSQPGYWQYLFVADRCRLTLNTSEYTRSNRQTNSYEISQGTAPDRTI